MLELTYKGMAKRRRLGYARDGSSEGIIATSEDSDTTEQVKKTRDLRCRARDADTEETPVAERGSMMRA
jgi:hypothetical protein